MALPGTTGKRKTPKGNAMKRILLGATSIIVLGMAVPASAADLAARPYTKAPPPMAAAIYDWSGFYIGGNGGGGWSHNCWDLVATAAAGTLPAPLAEGCNNASGATAGGQIGYRWQSSTWVFGLEGQGNWANFRGSNTNLLGGTPLVAAGLTDQTRVDAFGLLTGQVGWAWNNVLGYVKGGAAVVGDQHRTFTAAGVLADSANETRWGGTVGAGIEVGFAPNWSVGFEYDHLFMGTHNISAVTPAGAFSATDRIGQDIDLATVRLNYRWGGPVVARY
jgi:outer membrane immunogenic protein